MPALKFSDGYDSCSCSRNKESGVDTTGHDGPPPTDGAACTDSGGRSTSRPGEQLTPEASNELAQPEQPMRQESLAR
jgi:hypothetical protein